MRDCRRDAARSLLAGFAAAALLGTLAGCGAAPAAGEGGAGLPLSSSPMVMPVYAPDGREAVLSAAVYPVVVASLRSPSDLRRISAAYARVPQPKRPLVLVLVGASGDLPAAAVRQAAGELGRNGVSLPWGLQIGPPDLYAASTPALITASPSGQEHKAVGLRAVLAAMPSAVALQSPPQANGSKSPQAPARGKEAPR